MYSDLGVPLFKVHKITHAMIDVKFRASEKYPYLHRFLSAWTDWMVSQNAFAE